MKTPTWQLSTFPRWLHHWRFTPTECVPRLGKLLESKAMIPSGSPNRSATWPTNTVTKGRCSQGGGALHVMLALRCRSRQVVVADEELNGLDMVGELLGTL